MMRIVTGRRDFAREERPRRILMCWREEVGGIGLLREQIGLMMAKINGVAGGRLKNGNCEAVSMPKIWVLLWDLEMKASSWID